jgi:hypothetical protein
MHILQYGVLVLSLAVCAGAFGTERKAYKHVDEKGNVTYSQTPPVEGRKVQQIDISPAQAGRGGHAVTGSRELHMQRSRSYQDDYSKARENYERQRREAEQKRLDSLRAECARNRGNDCDNPETLRQMDAQRIPGGGRVNRVYR